MAGLFLYKHSVCIAVFCFLRRFRLELWTSKTLFDLTPAFAHIFKWNLFTQDIYTREDLGNWKKFFFGLISKSSINKIISFFLQKMPFLYKLNQKCFISPKGKLSNSIQINLKLEWLKSEFWLFSAALFWAWKSQDFYAHFTSTYYEQRLKSNRKLTNTFPVLFHCVQQTIFCRQGKFCFCWNGQKCLYHCI